MTFSSSLQRQLHDMLMRILETLQLSLTRQAQDNILAYLALIHRWNQTHNLTAITDPLAMMTKHIADSLVVAPYLVGTRIIDVGSGAGLPGVPLSLLFPEWQWTLLDSNGKKTRFLVHVKAHLGLQNVTIVQARVEDFVPTTCFHGVITRAWTQLNDMMMKTRHLYCPGGQLWAMKGVYPKVELEGLKQPFQVHSLQVPELEEQRHLVCVDVN